MTQSTEHVKSCNFYLKYTSVTKYVNGIYAPQQSDGRAAA
jgi:hypothetical protein